MYHFVSLATVVFAAASSVSGLAIPRDTATPPAGWLTDILEVCNLSARSYHTQPNNFGHSPMQTITSFIFLPIVKIVTTPLSLMNVATRAWYVFKCYYLVPIHLNLGIRLHRV